MIALSLLGLALTVVIKSAAGNIFNAQQAHMMGIVTDLARGKMYDIEDKLIKDGFSDTEQHEEDQAFTEEGWPSIHYSYKVELVELPGFDQLQALAQGSGSAARAGAGAKGSAGSGSGDKFELTDPSGGGGGFQDSMLGGMMAQFGGLAGFGGGGGKGSADINAAVGASFVQSQYSMFQQILKVTIRKITLTMNWQVMGHDSDMKVVAFITDAAGMDKVISGMGSQDLDDANAAKAKGSGSGSNRGSNAGSNK
jgi:general secretion pathway protein I